MPLGDFTAQADAYHRARPTYPAALLDVLIAEAGLAPGDTVADFGAGTGIMTQLLVERGFNVTAVEPNLTMIQKAEPSRAKWVQGTFKESHLDDASQNYAIAAQAFHWAEPARALPELRRILKAGSLLTLVWNNRAVEASEVLQWTEAAIRRLVPEFDEAYRRRDWPAILESTGDFQFTTAHRARHSIVMSAERYLELWRSHNRLATLAGPERLAIFLKQLESYLTENKLHELDVPYDCDAWSARRID
jgi:ubiquinone/menaquinone biosynthesis C-methylase UbiE